MNSLAERLESLEMLAAGLVVDEVRGAALRAASEAEIVQILAAAAAVQRHLDAVLVEAVGEAAARSSSGMRDDRMTSRYGCRDVNELVQRATRLSPQSAGRLQRAAKAVEVDAAIVSGELLPAPLPAMREALLDGVVGVDGILAVAGALLQTVPRADRAVLETADQLLAAAARGEGPDGAPPACADLLRIQAQAWAVVLDQDGAEPRERMAMHKRGVTLDTAGAHGVPVRGILLPEVAAQLQRIFDAHLAPAVDGVRFRDTETETDGTADVPLDVRTRAQKQHDALASALSVAASSGLLPTIGGAAPTLIVSVRAEDVAAGTGYAHVDGCEAPVSLATALHTACAGVIQRVTLGDDGRIQRIGTEERVFNRHQRRAIALRDGGCVIPGCRVPAGWCEIHHVTEHAAGGPTHTDNGVLLCWFHHRSLDSSGWGIRMTRGVPEVRAPGWFDASLRWRAVSTSPTRLRDAVRRT